MTLDEIKRNRCHYVCRRDWFMVGIYDLLIHVLEQRA
jgi:hypothetical protein